MGSLGPPAPGPGPGGGEGGSRSISLRDNGMLLEHVCFELDALCYGLASCGAINEIPCADPVRHLCQVDVPAKWHLEIT